MKRIDFTKAIHEFKTSDKFFYSIEKVNDDLCITQRVGERIFDYAVIPSILKEVIGIYVERSIANQNGKIKQLLGIADV